MNKLTWSISHDPILAERMVASAIDQTVGGWVHFAGVVRNHNHGRAVTHLEYECYETLAGHSLTGILQDAARLYPITSAEVVHRVGRLGIGDIAVWINVYAHHRDAAFRACRYIIDTLKKDVPIWKKEFYADGSTNWTRCHEHDEGHHHHDHHHHAGVATKGDHHS